MTTKTRPTFETAVHIIGCGGVGSHLAIALARMGVTELHLYDADKFEPHNLANQHVMTSELGMNKSLAVAEMITRITSCKIYTHQYSVTEYRELFGVVFVCVDSMNSRKKIMESCLQGYKDIDCVIETRMDSGTGIVHCFDPNNARHCASWWEQFYNDDATENMAGCAGVVSIISAVLGTVALALRSFEAYWTDGNCFNLPNRQYLDFDTLQSRQVFWDSDPHWD